MPKALIRKKDKFLDDLSKKQIRDAKATIQINQRRMKADHGESEMFKGMSKKSLIKMVSLLYSPNFPDC